MESATVVEGPIYDSLLTPRSYLYNKLPDKAITDEKSIHSIQSDVSAIPFRCLNRLTTLLVYVFYEIHAQNRDRGEG